RRDVEAYAATPPTPPTPASTPTATSAPASSAPATPDGCQQFKDICSADPFSVDKCRADLKPLSLSQQVAWADCVNDSSLSCQKAHDACVVKAKKAPRGDPATKSSK